MNKALQKPIKKLCSVIVNNPELFVGAAAAIGLYGAEIVKAISVRNGAIFNVKRFNNYGSYNGGATQYMEESTEHTIIRDKRNPNLKDKIREGCARNETAINLAKAKEVK